MKIFVSLYLGILLVFAPAPALAADVQVITAATLQDLTSVASLSPAIKAILAYEAMQASTGCPAYRDADDHTAADGHLHCALTDALGLGYQCSPAHTEMVRRWFDRNLNKLLGSGIAANFVLKDQNWTYFCQTAADEASAQSMWNSLRLRIRADRVTVDGEINSRNRDEKRGIYVTSQKSHAVYRIHDDWVEVISATHP